MANKFISCFLILAQLLALAPIPARAAISEVDKSSLVTTKNYATNGGAENGKTGWTVSGTSAVAGDLALVTGAANVYEGNGAFTWTPANADNYLTNTSVTITSAGGLSGASCSTIVWTKTTATSHALEAYDGTNVVASITIPASTGFIPNVLGPFPCPSSGTMTMRFNAGATTAISFDSLKWGDARGINLMNVAQSQFIGSAYIPGTTNCLPTRTSSTLGALVDTDCPGATVESNPGPGTIQTTDYDTVKFAVNGLPAGTYFVQMAFPAYVATSNSFCQFAINDGSTTSGARGWDCNTSTATPVEVTGIFTYTSSGNRTFELYAADFSSHQVNVEINIASASANAWFHIYRFPSASELAVRQDTTPASWAGYHDQDCLFARTNTAFGDPTADATCTFTETQNRNFGTVSSNTSGGNKLPGITFTPPRVGRYYVCALGIWNVNVAGTVASVRLTDGTNVVSIAQFWQASALVNTQFSACGLWNASSLASATLTLQTAASANTVDIERSSSIGHAVEWTIFQLDAAFPAPILTPLTAQDNGSEGAGTTTLTSQSNHRQLTTLTAARTYTLPSSGVSAGDEWTITNNGDFALTINASGGTAVAVLNVGTIRLISRIATPTAKADWIVQSIFSTTTLSSTWSFNGSGGTSSSDSITLRRVGDFVTMYTSGPIATTGTSSTTFTTNTASPAAFRPGTQQVMPFTAVRNNGAAVGGAGAVRALTGGTFQLTRDYGLTAWTNSASGGFQDAFVGSYYSPL
jgi:hypothetical protein